MTVIQKMGAKVYCGSTYKQKIKWLLQRCVIALKKGQITIRNTITN